MKSWVYITGAVIGAVGLLGAAMITGHLAQSHAGNHIFTGVVRGEGARPVARARVTAFQDHQSQTLYTDADGIFHLSEPNEKTFLKLTVDAEGYESMSKDTDPQRVGPEEIFLVHKTSPVPGDPAPGDLNPAKHSVVIIGNNNKVRQ